MRPATHGPHCNAQTIPMKCRECGDSVFFFRCNHGCKVFFDDLGPPWPLHHCFMAWGRSLWRTREADGTQVVQISPGVTARRPPENPPENFSISPETIRAAKGWCEKPADHPIKAIRAYYRRSVATTITGVLREKTVEANIFKECDIDPTKPVAAKSLGELGTQPVGRVTIHTQQESPPILHSYTVWLSSKTLSDPKNKTGAVISAHIEPVSALNRETVWHATQYEILGMAS